MPHYAIPELARVHVLPNVGGLIELSTHLRANESETRYKLIRARTAGNSMRSSRK
jgi:hypothetical protein